MKYQLTLILTGLLTLSACENHDINEGEEFRPRALDDTFQDSHFSKVKVDGVEYLMLERDNNNPHEGFGFMAFRGNIMLEKQDSLLAYMRALSEFQVKYFAEVTKKDQSEVSREFRQIYQKYLTFETSELEELELDSLDAEQLKYEPKKKK